MFARTNFHGPQTRKAHSTIDKGQIMKGIIVDIHCKNAFTYFFLLCKGNTLERQCIFLFSQDKDIGVFIVFFLSIHFSWKKEKYIENAILAYAVYALIMAGPAQKRTANSCSCQFCLYLG